MAAVDTLVFLDNLEYTHTNTAVLWSIDAVGSSNEAVKTYPISIPESFSAVRVIFNNFYDTAPSTVDVRVGLTHVSARSSTGVPTKVENSVVFPWTAVGATAPTCFIETGAIDVSAMSEPVLHISMALTSTTAHTGTEVITQGRSKASQDVWTTLFPFVGPIGTAISMACAAANAAQNVIGVTNPTVGFDWNGKFIYYRDTVDVTKSEILYQIEFGADA